ncbi:transglutaminase family protein [Leucothrix sargassi]|nr:transglutaminase family protein [Leucothrix sargassi]
MTIKVALNHKTSYEYDRPVSLSPHVIRLRPAAHSRTPIQSYSLKIEPEEHYINWMQDPFGNYEARLVFPEKTTKFSFEVDLIADLTVINPFEFFVEEYAENYPFQYEKVLKTELAPYLKKGRKYKRLSAWLDTVDRSEVRIQDLLVQLNQRLEKEIGYNIRMEPGVQTCEETLKLKKGSCRDTAWLLVNILRHLGLAARFVSGYLVQLTADEKSLDGPSGPAEDFTDLHAWCEVFIPGAGWVGLDPTSGLFASEGHIPLACTPDPYGAAPVTGGMEKCEVLNFDFSNTVQRFFEDPRVTKPYTEDQWDAINALGYQVDKELEAGDVRLTMGGEPTFVSIDDMEHEQWNTGALGEDKRRLAGELFLRMKERFSQGALLHYGQGKWYPGEEIPRWALSCFWRNDGLKIWQDPKLIAEDNKDYKHDEKTAKEFSELLTKHLGIDEKYVVPAYEDKMYFLWKEGSLPANLDSEDADLKDSLERQAIARVLLRGLDTPAGYALPLSWDFVQQGWHSAPWEFRNDKLLLIPGDSPMGLRLPLGSLPWQAEDEREIQVERCGMEPRDELENYAKDVEKRFKKSSKKKSKKQQKYEAQKILVDVPHTAMSIEARNGCLCIFMPPMSHLEHYLDLVASVEATAEKLGTPVRIEGYPPPRDHRVTSFAVTPDPGVIEVNIHPANNWKELVDNTTALYEEARLTRLGTEKFMHDGRHTGTGGGNHVTLGAANPTDSPFLRRPELLQSLITYWQHHPALSYLFSGLFIGPTSQAPRVDEGRDEKLYELDIAFSQMPEGETDKPWLSDRLLRHLLTDLTGNTHRSEFCIDKMYSPDSASGRQGILEFRGFEMPPHARMSLMQGLLIRSLVAMFWNKPYKKPMVRWGTELHDRFMLRHYIESDMKDVVRDLNDAGYDFKFDWLTPFIEFRFPRYGSVQIGDINMHLYNAIEPWHVLGEESGSQGTARYVDSSLERLQVTLEGLTDSRYILVCNGQRVPLKSTGKHGEYVAGIRYRAWNPPSALHPTIGVHAPLVLDLVDTWNERSVGGCTYHVAHPGGLNPEYSPINPLEAESRRISRYWEFGHSPVSISNPGYQDIQRDIKPHATSAKKFSELARKETNEYPYTLDLRNTLKQP